MPDQNNLCFVIAPIGASGSIERKRSNQVLKYVVRPAAESCGYSALRADDISEPGIITSQIIQHLVDDPIVIADLTGGNPNVFYELAIRHASGKPCVQLIEEGEPLPFDVSPLRTIMLNHRDLKSADAARRAIEQQIQSIQANAGHAETPISVALDFEALRLRRFILPTKNPVFDGDEIRQSEHGLARTAFAIDFTRAGVEARAERGAVTRGAVLGVCFQDARITGDDLEIWLTIENQGKFMQRWFGCILTAYASPVYAELAPAPSKGAANSLVDLYPGEQFSVYYLFSLSPDIRGPKFLTCRSWDKSTSFWWARGA